MALLKQLTEASRFKRYAISILIVLTALLFARLGFADITAPTLPDGSAASDNFIDDMAKIIKGMFQVGIYALLAVGWLIAASLIINGAIGIFNQKGGVGGFFVGIAVAFIMVVATTYFLDKGETALDDIKAAASIIEPTSDASTQLS